MKGAAYDVVVAGAGPGGAVCALACARRGLRTLLVEAGARGKHGLDCVLEVGKDIFGLIDLPPPAGDELAFVDSGVKVYSPAGQFAFELPEHPLHMARLGKFSQRLARAAADAGAETLYNFVVERPLTDGARVVGLVGRGKDGRRAIRARLVVDATGNAAALTRRLPAACGIDFSDRPTACVLAESRLCAIDVRAAKKAADAGRFEPDYLHHQVGVQGAYSVRGVMISLEQGLAWMLSGIKAENSPPTPTEALDDYAREFGFFGKSRCVARAGIRIRRASLRLVCDGFATIGEAAGMVIPLHASGVNSAILAGLSLAEHSGRFLRDGGEATTANLWPWAADYQRGRGAVLAGYDASRRATEVLDPERDLEPVFTHGLTLAEDMMKTVTVDPIRPSLASLPMRLPGLLRAPAAAMRFGSVGPKMAWVDRHWRNYPPAWDPDAFAAWKAEAEKMLP
jgi:flavin-dependent dehydrogenase